MKSVLAAFPEANKTQPAEAVAGSLCGPAVTLGSAVFAGLRYFGPAPLAVTNATVQIGTGRNTD